MLKLFMYVDGMQRLVVKGFYIKDTNKAQTLHCTAMTTAAWTNYNGTKKRQSVSSLSNSTLARRERQSLNYGNAWNKCPARYLEKLSVEWCHQRISVNIIWKLFFRVGPLLTGT